ncbi:hypothetical protein ES708_08018 [subsurface metagenome]
MYPKRREQLTEAKFRPTEQKRAEELLLRIIDGSPIATFTINKQHKVTHWNTALESLSGIKKEEVVGIDKQWVAFYTKKRAVMADLIVDGVSAAEIERYYGDEGKTTQSNQLDFVLSCKAMLGLPVVAG